MIRHENWEIRLLQIPYQQYITGPFGFSLSGNLLGDYHEREASIVEDMGSFYSIKFQQTENWNTWRNEMQHVAPASSHQIISKLSCAHPYIMFCNWATRRSIFGQRIHDLTGSNSIRRHRGCNNDKFNLGPQWVNKESADFYPCHIRINLKVVW